MGNNFNQVVKVFHTHFSTASAAGKLRILEQEMARLTAISERILSLVERFEGREEIEEKQ